MKSLSINIVIAAVWLFALYGTVCAVRDISAIGLEPIKTYTAGDHLIQIRSYRTGWSRKYEAIVDDWEDVVAGYSSADDALRAAQAKIKEFEKEYPDDGKSIDTEIPPVAEKGNGK